MTQLVPILVLAALAGWWWTSMRAREAAAASARRACTTFDAQFLDDSVVLRRLRPRRDPAGLPCLRRVYTFEFTRSGGARHTGYATLLGHRVVDVHLDAVEGDGAAGGRWTPH